MSGWLVEALGASTILMVLVLALRGAVVRQFGARFGYLLWALPALRMILPPLPPAWRPAVAIPVLVHEYPAAPADGWHVGLVPLAQSGADVQALHAMATPTLLSNDIAPVAAIRVDWTPLLLGIWIAGSVLLLAWQVARYRRFVGRALRDATPIGMAAGTAILLSDRVGGPVATGIVRRRILLPRDFARRYDRAAQRLVLYHEAAHHDRGDIVANAAALAMLALHWWNPIAWIAHRAFRADQELACDASVIARLGAADRYAYASAVARSAGFCAPATAAALGSARDLKRRLTMMARDPSSRTRLLLGTLFATVVIGGGLVASASVVSAEDAARAQGRVPPAHARTILSQATPVRSVASAPAAALPGAVAPKARAPAEAAQASADAAAAWEADARAASRRAQADGLRAEAESRRAQAQAEREIARIDIPRLVRASLAAARSNLAAQCAASGHPVARGEQDFGTLAMCDRVAIDRATLAALEQARGEIARQQSEETARDAMAQALASVDAEIARLRAEPMVR